MLLKTSSAASDEVILSGSLIKGGSGTYNFDFLGTTSADLAIAMPTPSSHLKYTLSNFATNGGFSASDFSYTNMADGYGGVFSMDANNLYLIAYVLPEPGTAGLVLFTGMPMALLLVRRTKRSRKANK